MNYNRNVLIRYASILYAMAMAQAILWGLVGLIGTGVLTMIGGGSKGSTIIAAILGGLGGAGLGWLFSFMLRVTAQLVLCQVEKESHLQYIKNAAFGGMRADQINSQSMAERLAAEAAFRSRGNSMAASDHDSTEWGPVVTIPPSGQAVRTASSPSSPATDMPSEHSDIPSGESILNVNEESTKIRSRAEMQLLPDIQAILAKAVLSRHFVILKQLLDKAENELSALYPDGAPSAQWTDLRDSADEKAGKAATNEQKALNEGSCVGCRGRLSMYEAAEHVCTKCKAKSAAFDKLMHEQN